MLSLGVLNFFCVLLSFVMLTSKVFTFYYVGMNDVMYFVVD